MADDVLSMFAALASDASAGGYEKLARRPGRPLTFRRRLSPVLLLPLRAITPNGDWLAPRWRLPSGGTTGDPARAWGPIDHLHRGIDLAARPGEAVYAPAAGRIGDRWPAGDCRGGLSLFLDDGREVRFCDLAGAGGAVARLVAPGERVSEGQPLAVVARGFVHVALLDGGEFIDPRPSIPHDRQSA